MGAISRHGHSQSVKHAHGGFGTRHLFGSDVFISVINLDSSKFILEEPPQNTTSLFSLCCRLFDDISTYLTPARIKQAFTTPTRGPRSAFQEGQRVRIVGLKATTAR